MIYIRNEKFERVKLIRPTSLVWLKKAKLEGQCAITLPVSSDVSPYINIDYYIENSDDDMVCQIKKITIKTNEDTLENVYEIVGIDKINMLSQRITQKTTIYNNKNVEELIRELITENCIDVDNKRKLNIILGDVVGFTDTTSIEINIGTNIFTKIKELCEQFDYCMKLIRENDKWKFMLYSGNNYSYEQTKNPYIEFSDKFHNLITTNYNCDKSVYTNMAFVKNANDQIITVNDELSGEQRYETYIDGSSIERETLNEDEYSQLLINHGLNQLTGLTETFTGDVINTNVYSYRKNYNIGDIVNIRNNVGIQISARIIQIKEAYDINGIDITPSFEYRRLGG